MIKYIYSILFFLLLGTQFVPMQYFNNTESGLVQMIEEINETSSNLVEVKEVNSINYFLDNTNRPFFQFIDPKISIDYWIGNENLKMEIFYKETLRPPRYYFI